MASDAAINIRKQVIDHPQFSVIKERLLDALDATKASGVGKGFTILGPSGVGKSTLIQSFSSPLTAQEESRFVKRVILVDVPASPSKKSIASAILAGMQDPFAFSVRHSAEEKLARIVKLTRELKTQVLILDEGQHLSKRNHTNQYETADWLKNLLNATHILIVLAGLPSLEQFINVNEQLRRRFSSAYRLEPFTLNDPKSKLNFLGVLQSFQATLDVKAIKLTSPDAAKRMYFASCGLIDYVVMLLEKGSYIARQENTDIHLGILSRAFREEVWSSAPPDRNPFEMEFDMRPLTFSGEPFDGYKWGSTHETA